MYNEATSDLKYHDSFDGFDHLNRSTMHATQYSKNPPSLALLLQICVMYFTCANANYAGDILLLNVSMRMV